MILKAEIDLENYDEGNLSNIIEERLMKAVVADLKKFVTETAVKAITERLVSQIDQWIMETLLSFVDRPIQITDRYGEIQETYENINNLLKSKLDTFFSEDVDSQGKTITSKNCGYGERLTRLKYLVDERIKKQLDTWTTQVTKDVDNKIQNTLTTQLKAKVSENLLKKIDVTGLMGEF